MPVANGVIALWLGTNASIPAGWSRVTALDGFYVQGAVAGADADLTARGNAAHNHTSPSHNPVQDAHSHNFSAAAAAPFFTTQRTPAETDIAIPTHVHASKASNTATATNNGIAITVDNANNDLSYVDVIFISSDGTPSGIPDTAAAFFASDTLPTSWSRVHGDRYIKGATAGGDAGGTGGSLTHIHTSPAHTHTQNSHSHSGTTSNNPSTSSTAMLTVDAIVDSSVYPHTHVVTLSGTTATNQSVTTTIDSSNGEPIFKALNMVQNGVGANSLPDSIIALWSSTVASIPTDWARYTAQDTFFPKNAAANGQSGVTTGGSLTHTHTAADCQPTQNTHTHSTSVTQGAGVVTEAPIGDSINASRRTHSHTWSVTSTVATNQAASVSINANTSESAYPPYKRLIFIQFTEPPAVTSRPPSLPMMGFGA